MDIVEQLRKRASNRCNLGITEQPDAALDQDAATEIERLREALEKLSCNCTSNCDWDFDGEICPSWVARAALKGDK